MRLLKHRLAALVLFLWIAPFAASAANVTYPQDTTLAMTGSGITLTILAGSQADSLVVNASDFTVSVANGESFLLRYSGPTPGRFPNDGSLAECTYVSGNNDLTVSGPITVTITPSTSTCDAGGGGGGGSSSGGGGGGSVAPRATLISPAAGATLQGGAVNRIWWTVDGSQVTKARLRLTIDGVAYGIVATQTRPFSGYFDWPVPAIPTAQAMLTLEATGASDTVLASDTEDPFTIAYAGTPTTEPPPPTPQPSPTLGTPPASINEDKSLSGVTDACLGLELIKLADDGKADTQHDSAVYYCGADGRRYTFPNPKVFFSWYADFRGVVIVSAAKMASIPLGGNVTYKPGARMIKLQTDPKVYAVDRSGVLRWVTSEAVALRLYGAAWNTLIDDVSDAYFVNYRLGDPLS